MFISEPQLVSLKHHGKREVLQLINQMEECFNRPLVFDPDKVEPKWGRAASAITPGHWFYGVNIYGQRRRHKSCPGEVPTLNAAMYGFESEGGVQQGADLSKGPWQMAVGSCEYSSFAMERWLLVKWLPFINFNNNN